MCSVECRLQSYLYHFFFYFSSWKHLMPPGCPGGNKEGREGKGVTRQYGKIADFEVSKRWVRIIKECKIWRETKRLFMLQKWGDIKWIYFVQSKLVDLLLNQVFLYTVWPLGHILLPQLFSGSKNNMDILIEEKPLQDFFQI